MDTIKATRITEIEDSADLAHPGEACIRELRVYNSSSMTRAIIIRCPYCNRDMASTPIHRITFSIMSRILGFLGIGGGPTVTPKLVCPYSPAHAFSITNGRIRPAK